MNNSTFLHLLWLGIAIGSFLTGAFIFNGKDALPNVDQTVRSASSSSDHGERIGRLNSTSHFSNEGNNSNSPQRDSQFSEIEIQTLGENLKRAEDPISRKIAFAKILEALTPENAYLLREQIAHLPEKSAEFRDFHYAWGRMDGKAALAFAKNSPSRDMAATLAGYANADPKAALAYFDKLTAEDTFEYHSLPTGLADGLTDNHPELAIQFVKDRLAGGDRYTVKLLNTVVDSMITSHDPKTLAKLTREVPRGDLLNSISYKVVQHLSDTDPAMAYEWAGSLPNGSAKHKGIGASFARWAGKDPVEAAEHLSKIPKDQLNSAIYGFSSRAAYDDPVTALEWASTITVEKTRNSAVFDAGVAYFRKDPESAAQWLPNSGLPGKDQQRLLAKVKR